jgi:alpha-beta hydrolase superfamily lysophospholipase
MSKIAAQHSFHHEITYTTIDHHTLACYDWPVPTGSAKALVLLVHGLGEHMGRYQHVAFALQQAGYMVIGYDHVGHGLSSGKRGDTDTPDQLTEHLQHMVKEVKSLHPRLPLVLLGHSMGGLVVQRAAASDRSLADAVVMSSPALATFANAVQKLMLATLPKWLPHLRVDNGLKLEGLARDAQVVRDYKHDRLVHPLISASLGAWIVQEGIKAVQQAEQWQVPSLLLYAGQDKLVNPQGSADFSKRASAEVLQSHCFNVMYHEIFNDPEKQVVLQKLVHWLDARYASAHSS